MTTTERRWSAQVRAWRESGLSVREFSTGRAFSANSLRHWAYLLKKRGLLADEANIPTNVRLARVERTPPALAPAALTVEVGGARVSIPSGFDAATVSAVLGVLRDGVGGAR